MLCAALIAPAAVEAQTVLPLSVEGRVGVGVPTGDFGDGASAGVGFGATATYHVMPMIGIRAGYDYQRFSVDDDVEDVELDVTDSGFALGLALTPPLTPGLNLVLHADAIMHQLKISASDGAVSGSINSDRKVGFDVGAGLEFPIAPRASILPRVRYRQYGLNFDDEDIGGDVTYFAADVGLKIRF